jgi:hypothetical protein
MELDNLKSAWQGIDSNPRNSAELREMMQEKKHPALKRIRKQLVVESVLYTVFLVVYYDLFDGDRKPAYANVALVAALVLAIAHNLTGYALARKRMQGDNLRESLEEHLAKMKAFAFASVLTRVLAAAGLLFFFGSVIEFDQKRYWILAGMLLALGVQVALLSATWVKRLRRLKSAVDGLQAD